MNTVVVVLLIAACLSLPEAGSCGVEQIPYDDEKEVCCAGEIHNVAEGGVCCGGVWMLTDENICINRRIVIPRMKMCYDRVRGWTSYDPRFWVCCDNRIVDITPTVNCCDELVLYNPETQICDPIHHRIVERQPE